MTNLLWAQSIKPTKTLLKAKAFIGKLHYRSLQRPSTLRNELLFFYQTIQRMNTNIASEEIQNQFFSLISEEVFRAPKAYFLWALRFCRPRSPADLHPSFQTILSRRFSVICWNKRLMEGRGPSPASIINRTNSTLQWTGCKYGVNRTVRKKKFLWKAIASRRQKYSCTRTSYFWIIYTPVFYFTVHFLPK